ncbi:TolC family protein [Nafulsella turpanensis]|uniref:TolC family protein n=1 Tax=Nafulsella turpanensis TaxID=1265690 RepID=UPI00034A2435|nr:TolC family protein [Nafulsella turpanensis]
MKKAYFFLLILICFCNVGAFAQEPAPLAGPTRFPEGIDSLAIGEALVEIALENYPVQDALLFEVEQEDENITLARWSWLNDLDASFNLNEGNINPEITSSNLFFPRYNLRFSISPGIFISTPSKVKIAKLQKQIAQKNVMEQQLTIRKEVLSRYFTYLYSIQLLKIQAQAYQDVYSTFRLATEAFTNGEISLEEYNQALMAKNSVQRVRAEAERSMVLSELELEEVLGMSLEKALELIGE